MFTKALITTSMILTSSLSLAVTVSQSPSETMECTLHNCEKTYEIPLRSMRVEPVDTTEVPLPSSVLLLGIGLFGLGCCKRKNNTTKMGL